MLRFRGPTLILLSVLAATGPVRAQQAPSIPSQPWDASLAKQALKAPAPSAPPLNLDPAKVYTLAELVNIAEQNNPDTRVAWQNAKARASEVGIAQSTLYPTLAAVALAETTRGDILLDTRYVRQTLDSFAPLLSLDYTIFDFGRRLQEVAINRNRLLAANFQFNDTHRKIIFQVMQAYYRLLDAKGLQQAAEARLQNGLATLPDVLEARSAAAQADYNLQSALGALEIAHGDLATVLGISPLTQFQVQSIQDIKMPDSIEDTVEASIDKALAQRPDLMQQVAQLRAAGAEVKAARRNYFPTLNLDGEAGLGRRYGQQVGF